MVNQKVSTACPSSIPPRFVIPKPRPPTAGSPGAGYARKNPEPPTLEPDRDPDAVYILDSGVGLSFAHVNRLDLLAEHYPDQLEYVEDVLIEWRSQSTRPMFTLEPGHTADDKATRDNLIALKAAATTCLTQVPTLFGSHVDLGEDELENVDNLITELCALHPARANTGDGCRDGSTTTPPSTPAVDCDPNSLEKASVVRSSRRGSPSVEFASPRSRSE